MKEGEAGRGRAWSKGREGGSVGGREGGGREAGARQAGGAIRGGREGGRHWSMLSARHAQKHASGC